MAILQPQPVRPAPVFHPTTAKSSTTLPSSSFSDTISNQIVAGSTAPSSSSVTLSAIHPNGISANNLNEGTDGVLLEMNVGLSMNAVSLIQHSEIVDYNCTN